MAYFKAVCKMAKDEKTLEVTRLIEAPKVASVMKHLAKDYITITPLTIGEAVELGRRGYEIEKVA